MPDPTSLTQSALPPLGYHLQNSCLGPMKPISDQAAYQEAYPHTFECRMHFYAAQLNTIKGLWNRKYILYS